MARIFVALSVVVLALVAVAFAYSVNNFETHRFGVPRNNFTTLPSPLNRAQLCHEIGRISGCSGCEHGTKGSCVWMSKDGGITKRNVEEDQEFRFNPIEAVFECVPKDDIPELEFEDATWVVRSAMCPLDATKEPLVRLKAVDLKAGEFQDFAETSTIESSWFDSDLAEFPRVPWPVDRTSYYGALGAAYSDPVASYLIDCTQVVSRDIVDVHFEEGGQESTILNGFLLNDVDKFCVRLSLAAYISSRCPEYGVAVSGMCWSLYRHIIDHCASLGNPRRTSNMGHLRERIFNPAGEPYSKAHELYNVVPDDTPFCLKDFPIKASGAFEKMAGLFIPNDVLREMYLEFKPFEYDWPVNDV